MTDRSSYAKRALTRTFYGALAFVNPENRIAQRQFHRLRSRKPADRTQLRFVALGTTGVCNASCIHCPTGKAITAHVPRSTMPFELFQGIIDTIFEQGYSVQALNFGLFGDGLVDPLVVERARYARKMLPEVPIDVNTNGAAFNVERHSALKDHISVLTLHCESINAVTYDRLMAPLRLKNVFPRFEQILRAFPGMVRVSVPVSRANLNEIDEIADWFKARGAAEVVFDPIASRCTDDISVFESLALAPSQIRCAPEIMDDLIIDCDGKILACCQDFQRREVIGDVAADGLLTALEDARRHNFGRLIAEGRHEDAATCSKCIADLRTPEFPYDQRALSA